MATPTLAGCLSFLLLRAKEYVKERRADAVSHRVIGVVVVHMPCSQTATQVATA